MATNPAPSSALISQPNGSGAEVPQQASPGSAIAASGPADVRSSNPAPDRSHTIHEPSVLETAAGVTAIVGWTVLFAIGVVLPSEPYRTRLTNTTIPLSIWECLTNGFLHTLLHGNERSSALLRGGDYRRAGAQDADRRD